MDEYRLPERKYTEAEYLFQTIEMAAKSDEEYDVEFCSTPPPTADEAAMLPHSGGASVFSYNVVKRRPHRRYTVSHGAPPAPPSTPTSLSSSGTPPMPSPTASDAASVAGPTAATAAAADERLNSHILDYARKYKKTLNDQQRTDTELADLFNVVITITGGGDAKASSKLLQERGVCAESHVIRKNHATPKTFKIHRNLGANGGGDDEDSISAPENCIKYAAARSNANVTTRTGRRNRFTYSSKSYKYKVRVDAMVDTFDAAMSFNDA